MDENNVIDAQKSFEIQKLKDENQQLQNEVNKLKILLKEFDPDADTSDISDEEAICVEQIRKLKAHSAKRELSPDEIKALDTLVKNIRIIRGENTRSNSAKKAKEASKEELEKLAKGK